MTDRFVLIDGDWTLVQTLVQNLGSWYPYWSDRLIIFSGIFSGTFYGTSM